MGNIFTISVNLSLDKMVSCCWRRTCSTRDSFSSLQKDWERLRSERNDMMKKIELEEREYKRRLEAAVTWLSQVDSIEIEFDKLKTDYLQQSANNFVCGYCPTNFKTSYIFGKKVADLREEVVSLLDRKPDEVTQNSLITTPAERPIEPTIGMDSVLDKVLNYMDDEQFGIIGLYGMGGVGKTTLMTELHNKLCDSDQSFDVVFWIIISSTPTLSKVQNDIGSVIGFQSEQWKYKSQEAKSVDIYNVLKQKKYVLFLDDVWHRFDLIKLGVPRPDRTNKSKIVLTTRSKEVCGHMEAQKTIEITCLKDKEAWKLFREKVGENTINAHPKIHELAKVVAKECDGLPLALVVIGRTMACKTTPRAWNTAIDRLKKYNVEFKGIRDHVLPLLKFSYDSISNASMRSCFLYCSLYPEDYLIYKEDIIDKWICEGFLDTFVDLNEARNEGYDYIDTLINTCLLEESDPEKIKMHDVIREMAIWIACECGEVKNKFFVRAGVGLTEISNMAEFEGSERMSLMKNQINKLNGKPNCPNLVTLFLNNSNLKHIDNEFFHSMPNLRVLDLSYNGFLMKLPEEVCNLVTLQYLNLEFTVSSRRPIKLHNLINLKWLSVKDTRFFAQYPEGLLSSCKKLQVLDLYGSVGMLCPTFVEEIESLKHLKDLRIQISGDVNLSRFSPSHKLASITTELEVNTVTSKNFNLLFSQNMVNLKVLVIKDCLELEDLISKEINGTSKIINCNYFQSLRKLKISWCINLRDITMLTFAPNLEKIALVGCPEMKELCGEWKWDLEERKPSPFAKLVSLHLWESPKLERICPKNTMPLFPCLKEMRLFHCPMLKKLPFNSSSCNSGCGVAIYGNGEWWKELEWKDEATRIAFLHSFK